MQDPTEWLGRLVQLEGTIDAGMRKHTWLECSYRLREGWKSVEVRGSGCGWTLARHGRQAFATGTLRRDGGSFFFDAVQVGGNIEEFDHVRYFQPPAAQRVSEASVIGQADAFRRRVAARAPGSGAPDAVRLLRKEFMHGCFLRFDGSAGCWHNHQWNREKQDTPSAIYPVEGAPQFKLSVKDVKTEGDKGSFTVVSEVTAPGNDKETSDEPFILVLENGGWRVCGIG